jgi:hypothetical protein
MFEVPQASQAPPESPASPEAGLSLCTRDIMPESGWQRRFEDPIPLPDGRSLHTLRDAADYITGLPKEQSDLAQWPSHYRGVDTGGAKRTDNVGSDGLHEALT